MNRAVKSRKRRLRPLTAFPFRLIHTNDSFAESELKSRYLFIKLYTIALHRNKSQKIEMRVA